MGSNQPRELSWSARYFQGRAQRKVRGEQGAIARNYQSTPRLGTERGWGRTRGTASTAQPPRAGRTGPPGPGSLGRRARRAAARPARGEAPRSRTRRATSPPCGSPSAPAGRRGSAAARQAARAPLFSAPQAVSSDRHSQAVSCRVEQEQQRAPHRRRGLRRKAEGQPLQLLAGRQRVRLHAQLSSSSEPQSRLHTPLHAALELVACGTQRHGPAACAPACAAQCSSERRRRLGMQRESQPAAHTAGTLPLALSVRPAVK